MKNIKIYENNGGGIAAIIREGEKIVNILFGFEDGGLSYAEFIARAREGFPWADPYDPADHEGCSMEEVAAEIEDADPGVIEPDELIAEITERKIIIYPHAMGVAGEILFGLDYEESTND